MTRLIACLTIASALASPLVWPAGGELTRLRNENARLKAQIDALRQSCPVAAVSAAAPAVAAVSRAPAATTPVHTTAAADAGSSAALAVVPSPPLPGLAPHAPAPSAPSANADAAAAAAATPPAAAVSGAAVANYSVPSGYQLVPVKPPPDQEHYQKTGCDQGFLKGPAPGKWRDEAAWKPMHAGMSMSDVEATLGVEHYDVTHDGLLEWHYGQCGPTAEAVVRFNAGQVDAWRPPD
jgi:hypothetical protein